MRRFYLICYDIADDRRRARIFRVLNGWGDRIQFSVFCCQLNPRERHRLAETLKPFLHQAEDQVLFVPMGPVEGERPEPRMDSLGKTWSPEPRTQVV